jgi:hypothetical protein
MASSAAKPRAERDPQSVLAELAQRSGLKDVARSGTRVVPLPHRMDNWSGGPCLKNAESAGLDGQSAGLRSSCDSPLEKTGLNLGYRGECRRSGLSRCLDRDFSIAGNQEEAT